MRRSKPVARAVVDALCVALDVLAVYKVLVIVVRAHTTDPAVLEVLVVKVTLWTPNVRVLVRNEIAGNVDGCGLLPSVIVLRPLKLLAELEGECEFVLSVFVKDRLGIGTENPCLPMMGAGGLVKLPVEAHRCVTGAVSIEGLGIITIAGLEKNCSLAGVAIVCDSLR